MADAEKALAEEEEYESDLEDAPLPAVRRRAAASDDEGEDEEEEGGSPSALRKAGSDADSDGQGAAEVYDDDGGEGEYEEAYEDFEGGDGGVATKVVAAAREEEGGAGGELPAAAAVAGEEGEEKKEGEPYAVPTTGAFYMHDDRFQEARGRGRRGRMMSNSKLWNDKEEQAWVHDRYDTNLHDFHNDNIRRKPRGRFRGRGGGPSGRARGVSRGNFRGNRSRTYYHDDSKNYRYVPKESIIYHDDDKNVRKVPYDNVKNTTPKMPHAHNYDVNNLDFITKESHTHSGDAKSHKNTARVVRGRGSQRYQPRRSISEISSEKNNRSQNPEKVSSNANLGHQSQSSNSQPEQGFPIKQTSTSNLNSASPPFYPSGSLHQELPISQKMIERPTTTSRPFSSPTAMGHVSPTPQYGPVLGGKAFVPSAGLHAEAAIKGMDSLALHSSASSSSSSSNSQFPVATNEVTRDSVESAHPAFQQRLVQSYTRSMPKMPSEMFGARFSSSDKMLSSTQPTSSNLGEDTENCLLGGSNKSSIRSTVKGQHGGQGEEHASFLYGGAQVLGATGAMGQNFHGSPALLPVMQFGGQHPGGPGVRSIGMALPGFMSQQQFGLSNSEMTWLPILTGASGALGANYGSPYMAVDGSYYPQPSEHASSSVSSREPSAPSQLKSQETIEAVNNELSQRQNKPRRYSEMNFAE